MLVHGYQVVQPLETLRSPLSITRSEPLRPGAEAWNKARAIADQPIAMGYREGV